MISLHFAAIHAPSNKPSVMKLLLNSGADINARADDGMTPLHSALSTLDPATSVVNTLLTRGADVNARTTSGHDASRLCI